MLVLTGTGILLTTTIQWWYFLVALATVGVIFVISGFGGYWSLKRDHLVDMIK
jgi:ABC-type antimicrobial peptide transport system permease subunit